MTEDEYLRFEEVAKIKHEFRDGEIVDIAGGTVDHAGIASNLLRAVGNKLESTPCRPYGSNLRLRINRSRNYVYPDVTIICGPVQFAHPDTRSTITNPQAVIEVISPSTENGDRGDKFNDYRLIETLQEYFLVSQDRAQVETFYRQTDGIWAIGPCVTDLNHTVKFRSLNIEISMKNIYAGIEFQPIPPKPQKPDDSD